MKVIQDTGPRPFMSGTQVPVDMRISDDPEDQKMMVALITSRIYTDKVGAVEREYGCNAADANVEAGRGHIPIEVCLPNRLEPTFSVRDFGFGMTEEQILKTFILLGASTKRGSNLTTGMLGIGSKAGFAYGESFLVTSYTNGTKAVYKCYRDQGTLKLASMFKGKTDAPDGVEVKVPVRQSDFNEFVSKAEQIYRHFKVRPIIHGAKITWVDHSAEFSGTGWRYTGSGKSYAIMGNVGYELNADSMPGIGARMETLINLGVEMDFEIGDLEMAGHREGLEYKDHTRKALNKRLNVVANEVTKVFADRIAQAPTLWDAHRMYGDNFEKMGQNQYGVRTLKEVVNVGLSWKGTPITTARFDIRNVEKLPLRVAELAKSSYYRSKMIRTDDPECTHASEKTTLCINDLPSKANSPARIKGFFQQFPTQERLVIFTFDTDLAQKKYWAARQLDGAPTINLTSITPAVMPQSTSGPSAHKGKHSGKAFILVDQRPLGTGYGGKRINSNWWERIVVNYKKDDGVYVKISEFTPMTGKGDGELNCERFYDQVQELRACGLLKVPVHGFKHDRWGSLGPGWVSLDKHLEAVFHKAVIADNLIQAFADLCEADHHAEILDVKYKSLFGSQSEMHKYLDTVKRMRHPTGPINIMKYIDGGRSGEWITKPKLPKPTVELDDLADKVRKLYPMLGHIERIELSEASSNFVAAIADYVKMIGK